MHDLVAVFTLFVFMLSLLCFCVLPFSSANKHLYKHHYDEDWKGVRPVKNEWWGVRVALSVWSEVQTCTWPS